MLPLHRQFICHLAASFSAAYYSDLVAALHAVFDKLQCGDSQFTPRDTQFAFLQMSGRNDDFIEIQILYIADFCVQMNWDSGLLHLRPEVFKQISILSFK